MIRVYGKDLPKTNQKEFKIEKLIEETGDKLYAKWKVSCNSWIDKKDSLKQTRSLMFV